MPLQYAEQDTCYEYWRKAKQRGVWDPESFDFEQDKKDWEEKFTEDERKQFVQICNNFVGGEEAVTRTLAPYPLAVQALENPGFDQLQEEMYLTTQLWEEAKHVEFFGRFFDEVVGTEGTYEPDEFWASETSAFVDEELHEISTQLRYAIDEDQETLVHTLAEAVMHYMGLAEAILARVGYVAFGQMLDRKDALPGFQKGLEKTAEDEGRHVANGRWLMRQLAEHDPSVVPEVYEPKVEDFMDRVLTPTIMNFFGDGNPLAVDADTLFDKAQGNHQSNIEAIGADQFEVDVGSAAD